MGAFKRGIIVSVLVLVLMGCASVRTTITDPDGKQWIVQSKKDARIVITKKDNVTVEVDNRGKTGWIEGLMQYILAKPDIKLSNKEGN